MEELNEISKEHIQMTFVSTCIESVARIYNIPYQEVFKRISQVELIDNYILPNYELLHSLSRETLASNIKEYLENWSASTAATLARLCTTNLQDYTYTATSISLMISAKNLKSEKVKL